jgi:hypothetical protein
MKIKNLILILQISIYLCDLQAISNNTNNSLNNLFITNNTDLNDFDKRDIELEYEEEYNKQLINNAKILSNTSIEDIALLQWQEELSSFEAAESITIEIPIGGEEVFIHYIDSL